jgi:CysZ protein
LDKKAVNRPWNGVLWFIRGFSLVLVPGVKRYVVVPLAINVVLFAGVLFAGAMAVNELVVWLQGGIPGWLEWLAWLLWPLYFVAAFVVLFYVAGMLAGLVAAPFMGPLAGAVEAHLRGAPAQQQQEDSSSRLQVVREAVLAVGFELRKMLYFLARAIPLLLLFLIPGLNALAPLLWLLFGAWMLAREYLDPPLGNHALGFREQGELIGRYRWAAFGFGAVASLANTVPLINFMILPVAVAGATAMMVEGMGRDPELIQGD